MSAAIVCNYVGIILDIGQEMEYDSKEVSVWTSVCVCVFVCLPPRLLITSGMMWREMDPMQLVKQDLQLLYGNCSRYR